MRSTIYELSTNPVPVHQRISPGYLPDWFFSSICDYATKMSTTEREESIAMLVAHFRDLCIRNGDQLRFSPLLKQHYFKESYEYFMETAKALSETNYDIFAGITPAPAFQTALHNFMESYADKHSFYVYEAEKLIPLDCWIRSADISKIFYIGGTIHYYY
ncbi:MAG: hypothetical protein IJ955_08500 [Oscillospiraceae bacterium]|nr:hypothetical protein [Oscillospiraceae bacterium]